MALGVYSQFITEYSIFHFLRISRGNTKIEQRSGERVGERLLFKRKNRMAKGERVGERLLAKPKNRAVKGEQDDGERLLGGKITGLKKGGKKETL